MPFRGLTWRHQVHLAIAYQVTPAQFLEGPAQFRPVIRVVIAQKSLMQAPLGQASHCGHGVTATRDSLQWVLAAVIHGSGGGHG